MITYYKFGLMCVYCSHFVALSALFDIKRDFQTMVSQKEDPNRDRERAAFFYKSWIYGRMACEPEPMLI
jgi:hypothetical protein